MDFRDFEKRGCHSILDNVSPQCGVFFIPIVASILSEGLDANQIATLGGFVAAVGDAMAYIAAQMDLNEEICERNSDSDPVVVP